jgi:hypothetical protein
VKESSVIQLLFLPSLQCSAGRVRRRWRQNPIWSIAKRPAGMACVESPLGATKKQATPSRDWIARVFGAAAPAMTTAYEHGRRYRVRINLAFTRGARGLGRYSGLRRSILRFGT